jgi:hypothetical protein
LAGAFTRSYNRFVDALSFGAKYQKQRRLLNDRIDSPGSIEDFPVSHPAGFVRDLKKRRITIGELYLIIIRSLESEHHAERINALRLLEEQAFHAKNVTMPLNTARVQLALMKEAIKSRDNERRQLELLHDFAVSSWGQASVIRRSLDEMGIIELPETGSRMEEMDAGWDSHVHDNSSYGRKTASQLVIDAFIKGISEITVAFNHLDNRANIEEVLVAGEILGVRVNVGVEFSLHTCRYRFHFMFLLPTLRSSGDLSAFFARHGAALQFFIDGLSRNQESRIRSLHALIDNFNSVFLPSLNDGYPSDSVYTLPALDLGQAGEVVPLESMNRMHLGELLYAGLKPVLQKRILLEKSRLHNARLELSHGGISQWDYRNIATRHQSLRDAYRDLNPEDLRARYFSSPQLSDYQSVFCDMAKVCGPLKEAGGKIRILHPLEHGLDAAYATVLLNHEWIDSIEVYNMHDSTNRPVDDILRFSRFINVLNGGLPEQVTPFLEGHDIPISNDNLEQMVRAIGRRPFVPVCGSDSTGRSATIPGMGFIFSSHLRGPHARRFREKHFALPEFVSRIIAEGGAHAAEKKAEGVHDPIVCLGKSTRFMPNKIGDETEVSPISLGHALRYLRPSLLNFLAIASGFAVAWLTIGWQYALVWFAITAIRNVLVDLAARRGHRIREWSLREVDFRNLAQSLFWTGVSVPVLALAKSGFDSLWPLTESGTLYQFSKFFVIALVNGLYLVLHNRLRGFDKGVTTINFFRNILSWPFASLFGPLGDLLFIPTIVQAKFWSDVVGGLIEGSGKFMRSILLTRRDLSEIMPVACASEEERRYTAILDLLYIFQRETRARNSMREIFFAKRSLLERLGDALAGRKARPQPHPDIYRTLTSWFGHVSNFQKLSDFAISHYQHDWALFLVDLVARQFYRFGEWLRKQSALSQPPSLK